MKVVVRMRRRLAVAPAHQVGVPRWECLRDIIVRVLLVPIISQYHCIVMVVVCVGQTTPASTVTHNYIYCFIWNSSGYRDGSRRLEIGTILKWSEVVLVCAVVSYRINYIVSRMCILRFVSNSG